MKKTLFAKLMAMSMTASMLLVSPVTAASNDAENGIVNRLMKQNMAL